MSKKSADKRKYEEEQDDPRLLVHEDMQHYVGGRKYIRRSELTNKVLLDFVFGEKIVQDCHVYDVTIETPSGDSFMIQLNSLSSSVKHLKQEIESGKSNELYDEV